MKYYARELGALSLGVSFVVVLYAGIYLAEQGLFWQFFIPYYLLGYVICAGWAIRHNQKTGESRQLLKLKLFFSLLGALFWWGLIGMSFFDKLEDKRHPANGNQA